MDKGPDHASHTPPPNDDTPEGDLDGSEGRQPFDSYPERIDNPSDEFCAVEDGSEGRQPSDSDPERIDSPSDEFCIVEDGSEGRQTF